MIISGTGHRPQDLPCGFEHKNEWKLKKIEQIKHFLLNNNVDIVISGMAIGYDTWLAYTAISVGIKVDAYLPFEGQECRWNEQYQKQYQKLLSRCNTIKYVCNPGYAAWKMQRRNEAMIRDCDVILSLWNPEKRYGGTWNAVAHATSVNKTIYNIWGDQTEIVKLY